MTRKPLFGDGLPSCEELARVAWAAVGQPMPEEMVQRCRRRDWSDGHRRANPPAEVEWLLTWLIEGRLPAWPRREEPRSETHWALPAEK